MGRPKICFRRSWPLFGKVIYDAQSDAYILPTIPEHSCALHQTLERKPYCCYELQSKRRPVPRHQCALKPPAEPISPPVVVKRADEKLPEAEVPNILTPLTGIRLISYAVSNTAKRAGTTVEQIAKGDPLFRNAFRRINAFIRSKNQGTLVEVLRDVLGLPSVAKQATEIKGETMLALAGRDPSRR